MTATVEERVNAGARLLDREQPGWHLNVVPALLIFTDCRACVLGQLYSEFSIGLDELLPDVDSDDTQARWEFAAGHGFDTAYDDGSDSPALTEAWLTEINTRRWSARPGNLTLTEVSA
jgi:hypothetical protein